LHDCAEVFNLAQWPIRKLFKSQKIFIADHLVIANFSKLNVPIQKFDRKLSQNGDWVNKPPRFTEKLAKRIFSKITLNRLLADTGLTK
jgi:hypothetical protein